MNHKLLLTIMSASLSLGSSFEYALSPLSWDVFLAPPVPVFDPPHNFSFSPTAFTLIHGARSAILVDAPLNIATTNNLADWIDATIPGKNLTHIYITHGHGDHFFGLPVLQQRFPGVQAVATNRTIAHMNEQLTPEWLVDFWGEYFPDGQIPAQTETVQALPSNGEFYLEGHLLKAVEVGQSDTYNTTVLHVPDLDLVVTGDAVYGECFLQMAETNTAALRAQWLRAVDEIKGLNPKILVPSHKQAWDGFGTDHLEKTKRYIEDWGTETEVAKNASDFLERIVKLYPKRVGDFILSVSVAEVFSATT